MYDRNVEIQNFVQEEYWTLTGIFQNGSEEEFTTVLTHLDNVSLEERPIRTKEKANKVHELLQSMKFFVFGVEKAEKEYSPPASFITTTLLQGASTVLGYSSKQTMQVAQELFEGISIDGQSLGLITYMRTDSTRVSHESQEEARHFIAKRFGKQYVSQIETAVQLSNGIQDAHECIRPTSMSITPQDIKNHLTKDQLGIYTIIFNRFMMSQMAAARHLEVTVKIRGGHKKKQVLFYGFSSQILFDGWRIVVKKGEVNKQPGLEALQEGEEIMAKDFLPQQHFTKALPHYSESVLI